MRVFGARRLGLRLAGAWLALTAGAAAAAELPAGASGWRVGGTAPADYEVRLDPAGGRDGSPCAVLSHRAGEPAGFVTLMQEVPAETYRGRRLRMSAWVRPEAVTGWAGLWMRVDRAGDGKALAFDNMQDRPLQGSSDWRRHAVVLDVPPEGGRVWFGLILAGKGVVRVDDFELEVVGPEVPPTDRFRRPGAERPGGAR